MSNKSMNESDKILWAQFIKSQDAKNAFSVWKKKQLQSVDDTQYNLRSKNKDDDPQYSAENPPPNQAYLYSPEFNEWCRKRDAEGLEY